MRVNLIIKIPINETICLDCYQHCGESDILFQGALVMTESRLSVNLYFTKAALPNAANVRGSHRRVAPNAILTARSPRWGGPSKCSFSPLKSYCLGFVLVPVSSLATDKSQDNVRLGNADAAPLEIKHHLMQDLIHDWVSSVVVLVQSECSKPWHVGFAKEIRLLAEPA